MDEGLTYPLYTLLHDPRPLRPKASPRSSPAHSFRSSCSAKSEEDILPLSDDGYEDPSPLSLTTRGRTLFLDRRNIGLRNFSPIPSRQRAVGPSSAYFSCHDPVQKQEKIRSTVPSITPDEVDGSSIFEPFPTSPTTSNLAEILLASGDTSSFDSCTQEEEQEQEEEGRNRYKFMNHRDTFEIHGRRKNINHKEEPRRASVILHPPPIFFQRLLRYVDFQTFLSLRLCCRCWSASISYARPVRLPSVVAQLPAEILQLVYSYLSPGDFRAARHTCRAWMIASSHCGLLEKILGGRGSAAVAKDDHVGDDAEGISGVGKTLPSEGSLRFPFTPYRIQNGFGDKKDDGFTDSRGRRITNSWKLISEIDGLFLLNDLPVDDENESELRFSMSLCGNFILAFKSRIIYICSFLKRLHEVEKDKDGGAHQLEIISCVTCPNPVRAVSIDIDTAHQRICVAALLEGRAGIVCELKTGVAEIMKRERGYVTGHSGSLSKNRYHSYPYEDTPAALLGRAAHPVHPTPPRNEHEPGYYSRHASDGVSASSGPTFPSLLLPSTASAETAPTSATVPLEEGPYFLYPNVCPHGAEPVSVATCTYRRQEQQQYHQHLCVAFGSSTGVKLYWIDILTGQATCRWVPLTTTRNEVLAFVPRIPNSIRLGGDRMRLISSLLEPFSSEEAEGGGWNGDEKRLGNDISTSTPLQYNNVVPLSDGYHFLYTDARSAMLCLGVQASPSASGTSDTVPGETSLNKTMKMKMKLDTRFMFEGPIVVDTHRVGVHDHDHGGLQKVISYPTPLVYKASEESRWGFRLIIAGFEDQVWGFRVPGEEFAEGRESGWHRGSGCEEQEQEQQINGKEVKYVLGTKIGEVGNQVVGIGIQTTSMGIKVLAWGDECRGKEWEWEGDALGGDEGLGGGMTMTGEEWEIEGEDGDVVMRDWDWGWEKDGDEGRWRNGKDGAGHRSVLKYADGTEVKREGERGEDVVMRDADDDDGDRDEDGNEGRRADVEVWEVY